MKLALKILLATALLIPACNRNEPRSTQAAPEERTNANTNDQMKAQRDDYVTTMNARLDEFDKRLTDSTRDPARSRERRNQTLRVLLTVCKTSARKSPGSWTI